MLRRQTVGLTLLLCATAAGCAAPQTVEVEPPAPVPVREWSEDDRQLRWIASYCSDADVQLDAITPDAAGRVHLAVHTTGGLTGEGVDVSSDHAGRRAFQRITLSADGALVAARGPSALTGEAVVVAQRVDHAEGLVAVGHFNGSLSIDETTTLTVRRRQDAFVVAYDAAGAVRWARAIESGGDLKVATVQVLPDGTVVVLGTHAKGATLSRRVSLGSVRGEAVFAAAYSSEGEALWAHSLITSRTGVSSPLSVRMVRGDIILAADYRGVAAIGEGRRAPTIESKGARDVVVMRLAQDGTIVWSQTAGTDGEERATDVTVSLDDDIAVVATSAPRMEEGEAQSFTNAPNSVIAFYDGQGSMRQVRRMNSSETSLTDASVASIPGGGMAFAGVMAEQVLLRGASSPLQAPSGRGVAVGRLHPDDDVAWAQVIDGDASRGQLHIRWLPSGDALVAGSFHGELVFSATSPEEERRVSCGENSGVFIARYRMRDWR